MELPRTTPDDRPDTLAETVAHGLPPGWHGQYVARTSSTQDLARQAAAAGAPDGTLFVADEQTAGRGRQGRSWLARPGTALMLSLLFRAAAPLPASLRYTMLVSVSLCEAIETIAPGLRADIKWPNDVLVGGRKVAGVLAEATFDGQALAVVVGCGVNVNEARAWLQGIAPQASSLAAEAGQPVDRVALLRALLRALDGWRECGQTELHTAWQARLWGQGQVLRLRGLDSAQEADAEVEATVLGADADGALRVRLADGRERRSFTAELIV